MLLQWEQMGNKPENLTILEQIPLNSLINISCSSSIRLRSEISTTIDERISDGFYYIQAMNEFKEILNKPERLEEKLEHFPVDI